MNRLLELARMLSTLRGDEYQGSVIARASWRRSPSNGKTGVFVRRKGRHLQQLECCCAAEDGGQEQLGVTLMLGGEPPLRKESGADTSVQTGLSQQFSAAEIKTFVRQVGDTNRIHQGDCPVVPGLLLLKAVLDRYPGRDVELRFHQAVFAAETVWLQEDGKEILAYVGEKKVFTARIGQR